MKYYTDGFTLNKNPSPIGGGYTIFDTYGLIKTVTIIKKGFTNNEGELLGLNECVKFADKMSTISVDSKCIISWVKKGKSKSRPDLTDIILETRNLIKDKNIFLIWESRDRNLAGIYNESK
jgi:ribonuclease HI